METSTEHLTNKITHTYSKTINQQEKVNDFLDEILEQKKIFRTIQKNIEQLSKLLTKISWLDNLSDADKILVNGILAMGKTADRYFWQYYDLMNRKYAKENLFQTELLTLKTAIENHKEDIDTLNHIIFELREDEDFQEIQSLIDGL